MLRQARMSVLDVISGEGEGGGGCQSRLVTVDSRACVEMASLGAVQ